MFHNQGPLIQAREHSGFIVRKTRRRSWASLTSAALSVRATQEAVYFLGLGKGLDHIQFLHVSVAVQIGALDEVQAETIGGTRAGAQRLFRTQDRVNLFMGPRKLCPRGLSS